MKTTCRTTALFLFSALVLATSSCSRNPSDDSGETPKADSGEPCERWISGSQARKLVADGGMLLDVRSPAEFQSGHLEGAKNIDVGELSGRLAEIPKDQHVVVYCRSGKRAHRAAVLLEERGYSVSEIGTQAQYAETAPAGCGGT